MCATRHDTISLDLFSPVFCCSRIAWKCSAGIMGWTQIGKINVNELCMMWPQMTVNIYWRIGVSKVEYLANVKYTLQYNCNKLAQQIV